MKGMSWAASHKGIRIKTNVNAFFIAPTLLSLSGLGGSSIFISGWISAALSDNLTRDALSDYLNFCLIALGFRDKGERMLSCQVLISSPHHLAIPSLSSYVMT